MTSVVEFGYQGQRSEIGRAIPVAHVQWFYRKARRITEAGAADRVARQRRDRGGSRAVRPRR